MDKIKVILIDDEPPAIERLECLLLENPGIEITGKSSKPDEGIDLILKMKPDLVFLDIEMPGKNGFDVVKEIKEGGLSPSFVFTTAYNHYAIKAIKNSIFDYLLKPIDVDELKVVLQKFQNTCFNHRTDQLERFCRHYKISEREKDVLRCLINGKSSAKIAEELFLSKHTVDSHRRRILEKTSQRSTTELISYILNN